MHQLSLIRPEVFSELIGQQALTKKIRKHVRKRNPKAWLFFGPRGTGKTTIAEIMCLSLQCKHQSEFGEPCDKCRKRRHKLPIYELNCADKTGIDDLRSFISGSEYTVLGPGLRQVYLLDEVHMLSKHAQTMLLKYLEDKDNPTVWILCSTNPHDINKALKRRCTCYAVEPLTSEHIEKLVRKLLKKVHSKLDVSQLVEALIERGRNEPGLICQAVDKYCAGNSPTEAADVEGGTQIDGKQLCRHVMSGDIEGMMRLLVLSPDEDARGLRMAVLSYFRSALFDATEVNSRNDAFSDAIKILSGTTGAENLTQMASLTSELYRCCKIFKDFKS